MSAARRPLSGARVDLEHGGYRASIASLGASLRVLQHEGRDLVLSYGLDELRPGYSGVTLVPWPNRVIDGRYTFADAEQQLPLTEPERGNALHGLGVWLDYAVAERAVDRVLLTATIEPQTGYPHRLDIAVEYRLDGEGLHQSVTATNSGDGPAPFGTGPHPYLVAGPGTVDDWALELPAAEVLTVTPDRLIPIGLADVAVEDDGVFDFRVPRPIAATFIDHAFTGLERDAAGVATVTVRSPTGSGVTMSFGEECRWVQVHTADDSARAGLAVEPMTCPPDAFTSGLDLLVLGAGDSATASWTIAALSS